MVVHAVISALWRLRQEDYMFENSLDYIFVSKTNKQTNKKAAEEKQRSLKGNSHLPDS
jgi:phage anti-repressor protein